MKLKDRDEFLQGWQQPDLLLQHLTSATSYGAGDLAVLWARLGALSVAALAVLGGCAWLFSAVMCGSGGWRWVTLAPLAIAATFVALCFFRLLRAAQPLYQSEPHRLQRLRDAWSQSRQQFEDKNPQGEDADLTEYTQRIEKTLILANWVDVADDFTKANKAKLTHANAATKHFFVSVAFLAASVVIWGVLLPLQPRSDQVQDVQGGLTMPQDVKEPPVVHPPTEVTERDNPPPPREDSPTIHPPTEVTEKTGSR